jgi:hypothetical protein
MRLDLWRAMALAMLILLADREAALAQSLPSRAVIVDSPISESPGMVVTLGTATLRKGKPKHLLRVDVRVQVTPVLGDSLALVDGILVNGHTFFSSVPGEPGDGHVCTDPANACAAGGTAWVDLDEAEVSFPGEFKGQPLEIEVVGRAESGATFASIRLRILGQLIKK